MHLPPKISKIHWWALAQTAGPVLILCVLAIWLGLRYVQPAPPSTITIATGSKGGGYALAAERYARELKKNGITLKVVLSQGSVDNLSRLADPHSGVDVALVQSGIKDDSKGGKAPADDGLGLESLGSMFYQPLMFFYRAPKPLSRLSELAGKRIAVGPQGSGTHYVAQALLTANGVAPGEAELLPLEGDAARTALLRHELDAALLTSDSASPETIRDLLLEPGIRLFDFTRADAYLRKFDYLHKIVIPAGTFDLGKDLPSSDLTLLAPTVELVARPSLHPALAEMLVAAAFDTRRRSSLMQPAGMFPNPAANDYPLNESAGHYYRSGDRSFLYRSLPFWLASLVNRLWVMLVPLVAVVIPAMRYVPDLYRWRIESRIHHRYGELMALEHESLVTGLSAERRAALVDRLNEIERAIIAYKIPGSHADQLYLLRQHINFVRGHLDPLSEPARHPAPLPPRRVGNQ
jgi:TRAP transporter TAXI family solute receptor